MLTRVLKRAKELAGNGEKLFATPALNFFLTNSYTQKDFEENRHIPEQFALLDDYDIFTSLKVWVNHPDRILSTLSNYLVNRKLFRIEMQNEPFEEEYIRDITARVRQKYSLDDESTGYFVFHDVTSNYTYHPGVDNIGILFKNGEVKDVTEVSDQLNINLLSKPTLKYFFCYPKGVV